MQAILKDMDERVLRWDLVCSRWLSSAACLQLGAEEFEMFCAMRFFPHMSAESNMCYLVGSLLYTIASSLSVARLRFGGCRSALVMT